MQNLIALLRIARPQFLASGLALFMFGVIWAIAGNAVVDPARIATGYLILLPAHLAVSYSNDYFDVDADRFGAPTLFSGGSGVLVSHPGLRRASLQIALLLHLSSLLGAVAYQLAYSPPLWVPAFVLGGNALAWWYTAPPLKLVYRGLGEVAMALSVGVLMPGLGYLVTSGPVIVDALWPCVPLMLYGLCFVLAVQIPDMQADRLGGKWTWVARHGQGSGFKLIALALVLASSYFCFAPPFGPFIDLSAFRGLGLCSILPLAASGLSLLHHRGEDDAIQRAHRILIALVLFCILTDVYLLIVLGN